jgi:mRNA interferase RelE/StbE
MGTPFVIAYHKDALAALKDIEPKKVRQQIIRRIDALGTDPKPPGCCKVVGGHGDELNEVYRVRQGDYRVIYAIRTSDVLVLDIGHRKDIYR